MQHFTEQKCGSAKHCGLAPYFSAQVNSQPVAILETRTENCREGSKLAKSLGKWRARQDSNLRPSA